MTLKKLSPYFLYFLIAAGGSAILLYLTRAYGPGVAPDSISYLSMAKHIAAGKGVAIYMPNLHTTSEPIASFSPLYPVLLSLFLLAQAPITLAAWILDAILLGLNLFAAAILVRRMSGYFWAGLAVMPLLFLNMGFLSMHTWILSEPTFILASILTLYFLWNAIEKSSTRDLILSALFVGAAALAKYIGIVYAVAGALCLILFLRTSIAKRLKAALGYVVIASIPLVAWLIRNALTAPSREPTTMARLLGTLFRRDRSLRPPLNVFIERSLSALRDETKSFFPFLQGHDTGALIFLLTLFVIFGIIAVIAIKKNKFQESKRFLILPLYGAIYVAGTLKALYLCNFETDIPGRYVLPAFLDLLFVSLICLSAAVYFLLRKFHKIGVKITLITITVVLMTGWAFALAQKSVPFYATFRERGVDDSYGNRWQFLHRMNWFPPENYDEKDLKEIFTGFGFCEGPVVNNRKEIFFTDMTKNMIYRIDPDGKLSTVSDHSNGSNGLAFDREDRLIACEQATGRLVRYEPNGSVTVLADSYGGNRLNSPNDVVVAKNGTIYFTDPGNTHQPTGLYRIPAGGKIERLAEGYGFPNGVALSPTERTLYVGDTNTGTLYAFSIGKDNEVSGGTFFARTKSPDGMAVDGRGYLYVANFGSGSITLFDPDGKNAGLIKVPEKDSSNAAFYDSKKKILLITAGHSLYRVKLRY